MLIRRRIHIIDHNTILILEVYKLKKIEFYLIFERFKMLFYAYKYTLLNKNIYHIRPFETRSAHSHFTSIS